jgi:excinuclease ABC subunit C
LALKKQKIHSQNIIGIAKGVTRKYENEEYFFCNFELGKENKIKEITLSKSSASILQITRDAVHNFAINSSRGQLIKTRTTSKIATLEGIGSKKQRDLLVYFGSVEGVKNATETELMKTPGIGRKIAQSIIKQMKNI